MEFVPYLVVDPGVNTTRIGKSGEDNPRMVIPSKVGVLESSSDPILGTEELSKFTEGMEIRPYMSDDGYISDIDLFIK